MGYLCIAGPMIAMQEAQYQLRRQVATFQLFDKQLHADKIIAESKPFYITDQANLISSATSLEYALSAQHLRVILDDWQKISQLRGLVNDYFMQTIKSDDRGIRVNINFDLYLKSRKDTQAFHETDFLRGLMVEKQDISQKSLNIPEQKYFDEDNFPIIIELNNDNSTVTNVSSFDRLPLVIPTPAQLNKSKIVIIDGHCNQENVSYQGEIEIGEQTKKMIQEAIATTARCAKVRQCIVKVKYKNAEIDFLVENDTEDDSEHSDERDKKKQSRQLQQRQLQSNERQVVTFQLFDEKIFESANKDDKQNIPISTLFKIDQEGNLTSCETGLKYLLLKKHLEVIRNDLSSVIYTKYLNDDYLMQTKQQQNTKNYIRVKINYDDIKILSGSMSLQNSVRQNGGLALIVNDFLSQNIIKIKSDKEILNQEDESNDAQNIIVITDRKPTIIGYNIPTNVLSAYHYVDAQFGLNKIFLTGEKLYNDEGIYYKGEVAVTPEVFDEMLDHLIEFNRQKLLVHLELENKVRITLSVQDVGNLAQQKKERIEKEKQAIKSAQKMRFWGKMLFAGGTICCVLVALWQYCNK